MQKPDYKGTGIVNLMSSILAHFGIESLYFPLKLFDSKEFKKKNNIVLFIIDGLGYEYLCKKGKSSFLKKHLRGKMTSVFPPTTATAITTFGTGTAPQQHAITGWFMWLKKLGVVSTILPFTPRYGEESFGKYGIKISHILRARDIFSQINCRSFTILPNVIKHSDFNRYQSRTLTKLGYETFNGFFMQISRALNSSDKQKFIFAYWPVFDELNHELGVNSKESYLHFRKLDRKIQKFSKKLDSKTSMIITSDHGFIDTTKDRTIFLRDHPRLKDCLIMPMCGDSRTKYCYVHADKIKEFKDYINKKMKKYCWLFSSKELVEKNYYGLYKPSKEFLERIGDFVLLMKENYVLKDLLISEKEKLHIGNHGGVSSKEMFVPFIII
ncbi:hypothetical protein GF327_07795 [Candidatus Woesearchaeota archaeon]|nr:hypothetical protein [Candidatus Woesearchaeota archaeon]